MVTGGGVVIGTGRVEMATENEPPVVVRQLTREAAVEATRIWAAGMNSYDPTLKPGENSDFVALKIGDETDMGDVYANYVEGFPARNFW